MKIHKEGNMLTLGEDIKVLVEDRPLSPNSIIEKNALVFRRPYILLVDGKALGRADWDMPLAPGASCMFVELPGGGEGGSDPVMIIAMVVIMAAAFFFAPYLAIGLANMMPGVAISMDLVAGILAMGGMFVFNSFYAGSIDDGVSSKKEETPYAFSQGRNQSRLGSPYPEPFGRCRIFPEFLMTNYSRNVDNEQYMHIIGIIGMGEYEIEQVYIDQTPIDEFLENTDNTSAGFVPPIEYNILGPGEAPTIVPNLVWHSSEAGGQDLSTDWYHFIVGPGGIQANGIELDFVCPGGLFKTSSEGDLRATDVTIATEYRMVDAQGDPVASLGTWEEGPQWYMREKIRVPVRRTFFIGVAPGRYEVRVKRLVEEKRKGNISDKIQIEKARAIGGPHPHYGDCTILEAKVRATNLLNGDMSQRFNVIATRKLKRVTASGREASLTATRNPVDALAHILIDINGGQVDDSSASDMIDFDTLASLRATYETLGYTFDFRFTNRTSVLDAIVKVARSGRAKPILPGGRFSLVRDVYQSTPTIIFTEKDYKKGSLDITHRYRTEIDPTCIKMEYVDEDTWEVASVMCYEDSGGSEDNPATMRLDGVTRRDQAWAEGMYYYLKDQYSRTLVKFTTGMKGHIPNIGSLIGVACKATDWNQTGVISRVNSSAQEIWLSEPVDFKGEATGTLYYMKSDGTIASGLTVTPSTVSTHCVEYSGSMSPVYTLDDGETASPFAFAPNGEELIMIQVTRIAPQSSEEITIEGEIMDSRAYQDIPDYGPPALDTVDPLESVTLEYVGDEEQREGASSAAGSSFVAEAYRFEVNWLGSAPMYRLEQDTGSGWNIIGDKILYVSKTLWVNIPDEAFPFKVRVTPYDDDSAETLLTAQAIIKTHEFVEPVTNFAISTTFGVRGILVEWEHPNPSVITDFEIEIEDVLGETESWIVTTAEAAAVGSSGLDYAHRIYAADVQKIKKNAVPPWKENLTIRVRAWNNDAISAWTENTIDLSVPLAPSSLDSETFSFNTSMELYFTNEDDYVDGFIVLSGPEAGWPTNPENYKVIKDMDGTSADSSVTSPYENGDRLTANLDTSDCFETHQPYTVAVAGYWENMKAVDFLLVSPVIQAYDVNTAGKKVSIVASLRADPDGSGGSSGGDTDITVYKTMGVESIEWNGPNSFKINFLKWRQDDKYILIFNASTWQYIDLGKAGGFYIWGAFQGGIVKYDSHLEVLLTDDADYYASKMDIGIVGD